jgi:hypothetical protein
MIIIITDTKKLQDRGGTIAGNYMRWHCSCKPSRAEQVRRTNIQSLNS